MNRTNTKLNSRYCVTIHVLCVLLSHSLVFLPYHTITIVSYSMRKSDLDLVTPRELCAMRSIFRTSSKVQSAFKVTNDTFLSHLKNTHQKTAFGFNDVSSENTIGNERIGRSNTTTAVGHRHSRRI